MGKHEKQIRKILKMLSTAITNSNAFRDQDVTTKKRTQKGPNVKQQVSNYLYRNEAYLLSFQKTRDQTSHI